MNDDDKRRPRASTFRTALLDRGSMARVTRARTARATRTHGVRSMGPPVMTLLDEEALLPEAAPTVLEYTSDELVADTIVMPVVGDRVVYVRGSGYLLGLEGVVVTDDRAPGLPSGLRWVLFDDEEWPTVVAVTGLERSPAASVQPSSPGTVTIRFW